MHYSARQPTKKLDSCEQDDSDVSITAVFTVLKVRSLNIIVSGTLIIARTTHTVLGPNNQCLSAK